MQRRLDVELTSDRLADHYTKYYDRLDATDRQKLTEARSVLEDIAEAIYAEREAK
jgi:hypothetical protein